MWVIIEPPLSYLQVICMRMNIDISTHTCIHIYIYIYIDGIWHPVRAVRSLAEVRAGSWSTTWRLVTAILE